MQINFPRIKKNKKNKKRYIIKKNKKEKENESLRRLFVLMELVQSTMARRCSTTFKTVSIEEQSRGRKRSIFMEQIGQEVAR